MYFKSIKNFIRKLKITIKLNLKNTQANSKSAYGTELLYIYIARALGH